MSLDFTIRPVNFLYMVIFSPNAHTYEIFQFFSSPLPRIIAPESPIYHSCSLNLLHGCYPETFLGQLLALELVFLDPVFLCFFLSWLSGFHSPPPSHFSSLLFCFFYHCMSENVFIIVSSFLAHVAV